MGYENIWASCEEYNCGRTIKSGIRYHYLLSYTPPSSPNPMLIILSGPSGAGKDTVFGHLMTQEEGCHFTITATTRERRESEQDGVDYIFLTDEQFSQMIRNDGLLEWAEVYGNLYGVPKAQIVDALERGEDVIVKTDVQGAATIKQLAPEGVFIFLAPGNIEELAERLSRRNTESLPDVELRLESAKSEIREAHKFDYLVVNRQGCLNDTITEIQKILEKERSKPKGRVVI